MSKMVWTEQKYPKMAVRIFRTRKAAFESGLLVVEMERSEAVGDIRRQAFWRSKGFCEICIAPITESSGHMHERQHRGKGGEISLDNSIFICPRCHKRAHADRSPRWTTPERKYGPIA